MKRVFWLTFVFVALVSCAFAGDEPTYSDCNTTGMTLTQICSIYHPNAPGLVGTAACLGDACFKEQTGYELTVLSDGKSGEFPKTWLVKVKPQGGKLDVTSYQGDQCVLPANDPGRHVGTGVHINLSKTNPNRCKLEREVGDHLYHDHFASNATTKCLAWIECREDKIPLTK